MDNTSSVQNVVLATQGEAKTKRGRPRDPSKEIFVLEAALHLLKEGGVNNLTLAKVATLSGVARPTIRLRWPNKEALSIAAVQKLFDDRSQLETLIADADMEVREMVRLVLVDLIAMLSEPGVVKVLSSLVVAAHYSEPLSDLRQYVLNRRGSQLRGLLKLGVLSGQFPKGMDKERVLDALNGPILSRMLVMNLPMDAKDADFIVDMVLPKAQ